MKVKKFVKQALIWLLVIVVAVVGYFVITVSKNLSMINSNSKEVVPLELTKNVNILLLGTDQRTPNEGARTDTIILVNINPKTKKINLMSIPRDSRVDIPGHGYDKINSAYNSDYFSDGGVNLSVKTVESILGLPDGSIPFYAVVNFQGFEKVIDALGGVTIDVKEPMHYHSSTGDVKIDLSPGVQHLDGQKALEYARFRYDVYGDFAVDSNGNVLGRVQRQEDLIKALVDQTKDVRTIWKFPAVSQAIGEAAKTNLTPGQITKLALLLKDATDKDINIVNFPGKPDYVEGISYVVPDFDKLKEIGTKYFGLSID
ncbi:MAG: LCP family protein [Caldisericaceae bacterium]